MVSDEFLTSPINAKYNNKTECSGNLSTIKVNDPKSELPKNNLALIRDGLVIKYHNHMFLERDDLFCAGVFLSTPSPVLRKLFVFSEPEAHDQWNSNHGRLGSKFNESGQRFIENTLSTIKRTCRGFQLKLEKLSYLETGTKVTFLNQILGNLISDGSGTPPQPKNVRRAFSIEKKRYSAVIDGKKTEHFEFKVKPRKNISIDKTNKFRLIVKLSALKDSNLLRGDNIKCSVVITQCNETGRKKIVPVTRDNKGRFIASVLLVDKVEGEATAIVHKDWIAKWSIEVDKEN